MKLEGGMLIPANKKLTNEPMTMADLEAEMVFHVFQMLQQRYRDAKRAPDRKRLNDLLIAYENEFSGVRAYDKP